MRNNKNNITLSYRNIISLLRNLIGYLTDNKKIITLCFVILILSLLNITLCLPNNSSNSVSALSYSNNVNVGFTFNPSLSVSLSSSDLVIDNLTPGTTSDSNSININIATNNAYGYSLYASVGNEDYNNTNLIRTDEDSIFSSIDTNANLANLTVNNTWGYSHSLNNSPTWSNYNGLPLYNSNISKRLARNTEPAEDTVGFKISAKSSTTQPSGTYSNVINFSAVAIMSPITLAEAYASEGKELYHGYYKMQDMTSAICEKTEDINAQLQVIDIRDDKVYWISKLADDHCWMTQNLDLDIISDPTDENYIALTSNNTDLSTDQSVYTANNTVYALKEEDESYGYIYENGVATWIPKRETIAYNNLSADTWQISNIDPYSYNRLDTSTGAPVYPDNNASQAIAGDHGLSGNYYNWTASIASNNSNNASSIHSVDQTNSICPKSWRLPSSANKEFGNLLVAYNIIETNTSASYIENQSSVNSMSAAPLYLVRGGYVNGGSLYNSGKYGTYWSSMFFRTNAYSLIFNSNNTNPQSSYPKLNGLSIRCLAR